MLNVVFKPDPTRTNICIKNMLRILDQNSLSNEIASRLMLLAMLSGNHFLVLNPSGTDRSEFVSIIRDVSNLIQTALDFSTEEYHSRPTVFERLITDTTSIDEWAGPVDMKASEWGIVERCSRGYFPTADIAFVDNIFKVNSAMLNDILSVVNGRISRNTGEVRVDLSLLIGCSDALPVDTALARLTDCFLFCTHIARATDELTFIRKLQSGQQPSLRNNNGSQDLSPTMSKDILTFPEILALQSWTLPTEMVLHKHYQLLARIQSALRVDRQMALSDHRFQRLLRAMKLSAYTHCRSVLDWEDFLIAPHSLWDSSLNTEDVAEVVRELWRVAVLDDYSGDNQIAQLRNLLANIDAYLFETTAAKEPWKRLLADASARRILCCYLERPVLSGDYLGLDRGHYSWTSLRMDDCLGMSLTGYDAVVLDLQDSAAHLRSKDFRNQFFRHIVASKKNLLITHDHLNFSDLVDDDVYEYIGWRVTPIQDYTWSTYTSVVRPPHTQHHQILAELDVDGFDVSETHDCSGQGRVTIVRPETRVLLKGTDALHSLYLMAFENPATGVRIVTCFAGHSPGLRGPHEVQVFAEAVKWLAASAENA